MDLGRPAKNKVGFPTGVALFLVSERWLRRPYTRMELNLFSRHPDRNCRLVAVKREDLNELDMAPQLQQLNVIGWLPDDPAHAVARANTALSVDGADVQASYVKAAALARLGQGDQARAALQVALDQEPDNYVTWALIGDLDVRRADFATARAEYRRAAQLDPLDARSDAGIPADPQAAAKLGGPRPTNVAHRPNMYGFQVIEDTSPLELARALGAPGLRSSDVVIVGLFGYGVG